MPYKDNTIIIQGGLDSATFYNLLIVLLAALFINCLINLILDKIRLEKIEICIHLIEKGHNRAVTGVALSKDGQTSTIENIKESDGGLLRVQKSKKKKPTI